MIPHVSTAPIGESVCTCVFKPKRMQNKKIVTDKHTEDKVYKGDLEHVTLQGGIVSKPRCV